MCVVRTTPSIGAMKSTGIDHKVIVFIDSSANLTAVHIYTYVCTYGYNTRLQPHVMQLSDAYECVANNASTVDPKIMRLLFQIREVRLECRHHAIASLYK